MERKKIFIVRCRSNDSIRLEETFSDIRYSKQQQWNVLYLTISAIAGIITLILNISISKCLYKYIFDTVIILAIISVCISGIAFIDQYRKDIKNYRKTKNTLLKNNKENDNNDEIDYWIPELFQFIIIIAAAVGLSVIFLTQYWIIALFIDLIFIAAAFGAIIIKITRNWRK